MAGLRTLTSIHLIWPDMVNFINSIHMNCCGHIKQSKFFRKENVIKKIKNTYVQKDDVFLVFFLYLIVGIIFWIARWIKLSNLLNVSSSYCVLWWCDKRAPALVLVYVHILKKFNTVSYWIQSKVTLLYN